MLAECSRASPARSFRGAAINKTNPLSVNLCTVRKEQLLHSCMLPNQGILHAHRGTLHLACLKVSHARAGSQYFCNRKVWVSRGSGHTAEHQHRAQELNSLGMQRLLQGMMLGEHCRPTSRGVCAKRSTGFGLHPFFKSHSAASSCPSAAAKCLRTAKELADSFDL